jgi:AcrR family transcriptional regulator
MSLRKEKAARLKLAVLDYTLRLVGKKPFDDLYVEEICDKVKISKVTLFKYFPRKEDILLYYYRIWCLRRAVELKLKPREGLQAIQFIFDKLSDEFEVCPGVWLSLLGYLADPKRTLRPFPVKLEEKQLLFPDVGEVHLIDIQSIDQMFEKFSLEAIFKKEITSTTSTRDIMHLLSTLFHGVVVTAHIHQLNPLKQLLRKNLELALRGL